jgi:hypothetical protein
MNYRKLETRLMNHNKEAYEMLLSVILINASVKETIKNYCSYCQSYEHKWKTYSYPPCKRYNVQIFHLILQLLL